jgi:hypothetical protein
MVGDRSSVAMATKTKKPPQAAEQLLLVYHHFIPEAMYELFEVFTTP